MIKIWRVICPVTFLPYVDRNQEFVRQLKIQILKVFQLEGKRNMFQELNLQEKKPKLKCQMETPGQKDRNNII
jgi:hypothetical protein